MPATSPSTATAWTAGRRRTFPRADVTCCCASPRGIRHCGMTERGGWYETHAAEAAARYESVAAEQINAWLLDLLPKRRAVVLDVGAGSGRDTAWLTSLGHEVVAADPSAAMRAQARRWHPDLGVQYLPDRLPELTKTFRTGISFDFILVNAVWMHVAPADRKSARFASWSRCSSREGSIAFSRCASQSFPGETCTRCRARRSRSWPASMVPSSNAESEGADLLGRTPLRWEQVAVQGAGRRHRRPSAPPSHHPQRRQVVHVQARPPPGALPNRGRCGRLGGRWGQGTIPITSLFPSDSSHSTGSVCSSRCWPRELPQSPGQPGPRSAWLCEASRTRATHGCPGCRSSGRHAQVAEDRRHDLHRALRDARNTVVEMPIRHLTYHDGSPIFPVERRHLGQAPGRWTAGCSVSMELRRLLRTPPSLASISALQRLDRACAHVRMGAADAPVRRDPRKEARRCCNRTEPGLVRAGSSSEDFP